MMSTLQIVGLNLHGFLAQQTSCEGSELYRNLVVRRRHAPGIANAMFFQI